MKNELAEILTKYATDAASLALSQPDIGEKFNYTNIEYNDDDTIKNKK